MSSIPSSFGNFPKLPQTVNFIAVQQNNRYQGSSWTGSRDFRKLSVQASRHPSAYRESSWLSGDSYTSDSSFFSSSLQSRSANALQIEEEPGASSLWSSTRTMQRNPSWIRSHPSNACEQKLPYQGTFFQREEIQLLCCETIAQRLLSNIDDTIAYNNNNIYK